MGQISTRKRGSTWEYSFEIAPIGGKRKRMSKGGFRTKKECLEAGTQAKAEYDNNGSVQNQTMISVSDWLDEWFESVIKLTVKESTQWNYRSVVKLLQKILGKYRLKTLTTLQIQQEIDKLLIEHKPSYVKLIKSVINSALSYAVKMQLITINPCTNVTIKCNKKEIKKVITIDDFNKVIELFNGNTKYHRIPLYISFYTGMRIGEVFALTWNDVDFKNKIINVDKTEIKINGVYRITSPKTTSSIRKILIGDSLINILKTWREYQINTALELDMEAPINVCTNLCLKKYPLTALQNTLTLKTGKQMHFHDIRHLHATTLIKNGVTPKEVQTRLGHSSIQTTLNIYTHLTASEGYASVDVFEALTNR